MARPPRFLVPGCPQHVIQRGNNRQAVFLNDGDRAFYLDCLRDASRRYGCPVHAYVLMTNHVHLLVSPQSGGALPRAMQSVGRRFAQHINWRHERSGTVWQGRYRATPVQTENYFLNCSRYIELNPVRAGMVAAPGEYAWSSYRANVLGAPDPLVTPHPLYLSLGRTDLECRSAYGAMFADDLDDAVMDRIREMTQKGWPLGDDDFRAGIGAATRRRAAPLPKGGSKPRRLPVAAAGEAEVLAKSQSTPTRLTGLARFAAPGQSTPTRLVKKRSIDSDPIEGQDLAESLALVTESR